MEPIEVGQQFLDEVLKLIPEDQREAARSAYSRAQNTYQSAIEAKLTPLQEKERQLTAWRTQLEGWSTGRETEIQRRERELAERERRLGTNPANPANPITQPPGTPSMPSTQQTFTLDEVQKLVTDRLTEGFDRFGKSLVPAMSESMALQHRHFQLYGNTKPFVLEELFKHPRVQEIGLVAAFEDLHKDRIAEIRDQATREAEAKIRADERAKVMAEIGSNKTLPFPTPGSDDSPFGIMARKEQTGEEYGAAAATRYFNELRAANPIPA